MKWQAIQPSQGRESASVWVRSQRPGMAPFTVRRTRHAHDKFQPQCGEVGIPLKELG